MNSKLGKPLRKLFRKRLLEEFSFFEENKNILCPPGYLTFVWTKSECLYFIIGLNVSPKDDRFTIDCAWTNKKSYFPLCLGNFDIHKKENYFRFPPLYEPNLQDKWWWLGKEVTLAMFDLPEEPIEEKLKTLEAQVNDAINKIKMYAIPLFEKVAEYHLRNQ